MARNARIIAARASAAGRPALMGPWVNSRLQMRQKGCTQPRPIFRASKRLCGTGSRRQGDGSCSAGITSATLTTRVLRDNIGLAGAGPDNRVDSQLKLTSVEAVPTAVIRSRVQPKELSKFVPAACGEVWSFIRSAGLPRPGRHVALYLADGLVEVGAEVSERFEGNDRVRCSQLPAGCVATVTHFGPYARLGAAREEIRQRCAAHGHHLSGVSWEIYGHWDESWNGDPSKIRTDVFHGLDAPG